MIPPNLALIAWIPLVVYLYRWLPSTRAFVISFIGAFQFMTNYVIVLPALIPFGKMAVTTYGIIIAIILFDINRLKSFRFHWIDLPMILFCLCPIPSYISNDLGIMEGLKATFADTVSWGAPYFLGRLYLGNLEGLRKLAVGIFVGGLLYIPFCAIENVKGPLLHEKIFGIPAFIDWSQARRWGGWRPVVFMQHGLQVGIWMMAAALIGIWLWKTGVLKRLGKIPMKYLVVALTISFFLTLSTGAWILMTCGLLILFTARWFRTSIPLFILILYLYFYLTNAMVNGGTREAIVSSLSLIFSQDRVASVDFRLMNEEILAERARERFWFGWAGNGRNMVRNPYSGQIASVTDSYWIIVFGIRGAVGIYCWLGALLLPVILFILCFPARFWSHRQLAPGAVLCVVITLYMLDCTMNAMLNPIFTIAVGGVSGIVIRFLRTGEDGVGFITAVSYCPNQPPVYQSLPAVQHSLKSEKSAVDDPMFKDA